MRPCLGCNERPQCHALIHVPRTRCATCQRFYDAYTGRDHAGASSTQRGYGREHQEERASWAQDVAGGTVACARCGMRIGASEAWDLGHSDDRTRWSGPEHRRCNRAAGLRAGQMRATA